MTLGRQQMAPLLSHNKKNNAILITLTIVFLLPPLILFPCVVVDRTISKKDGRLAWFGHQPWLHNGKLPFFAAPPLAPAAAVLAEQKAILWHGRSFQQYSVLPLDTLFVAFAANPNQV
jgi:hypothetical protein